MAADAPSFIAAARRQQVVDAATRVLAREGLSRTSLTRIAAEAGLSSPGLISYHFTDKDDVLKTMADQLVADCAAAVEHAVKAAPVPAEALRAYVEAFVGWQDAHRDGVRALWRLSAGWKAPCSDRAFDESGLVAPLLRLLDEGVRSGGFRPVDVRQVAGAVARAVQGFHEEVVGNPGLDVAAFADGLADLFERALEPRDGS